MQTWEIEIIFKKKTFHPLVGMTRTLVFIAGAVHRGEQRGEMEHAIFHREIWDIEAVDRIKQSQVNRNMLQNNNSLQVDRVAAAIYIHH